MINNVINCVSQKQHQRCIRVNELYISNDFKLNQELDWMDTFAGFVLNLADAHGRFKCFLQISFEFLY